MEVPSAVLGLQVARVDVDSSEGWGALSRGPGLPLSFSLPLPFSLSFPLPLQMGRYQPLAPIQTHQEVAGEDS